MSRIQKPRFIITIVAIILLIAGGVVAVLYFGGVFSPRNETVEEVAVPSTGKSYQPALREKEAEVADLIAAGGEQSIEQAEAIIEAEIQAAQKSQNVGYIVEATLAEARLQTETNRADQALETLFELERQYTNDPENLYLVYAEIAYAYKILEDVDKSNEYLAKIPGEGFND